MSRNFLLIVLLANLFVLLAYLLKVAGLDLLSGFIILSF